LTEYGDVEHRIRVEIGTDNYSKVKAILRAIYWNGHYQQLIAKLEMLPAELFDVKHHFENQEKEETNNQ
jgi:hypothetical protein